MAAPDLRPQELTSWKEIASYLGVAVRTAQLWERDRGLPVLRLPGGRGQVRANAAALDAWKEPPAVTHAVENSAEPLVPPQRSWLRSKWAWLLALGTVALGVPIALFLARPGVPSSYRFERNTLVVTDARGGVLWRKAFLALAPSTPSSPPDVWIGDLNGDGHTEVLYQLRTGLPGSGTVLICYAQDGVERWRFVPGRTVHTAAETFSPPFFIQAFVVARFGRAQVLRILVVSQHYLYYPSQVTLLTTDGRVVREYWHSGGLPFAIVGDLAGDGLNRILLAGVHNSTKSATVVVLDPDTMSGASAEENPLYQLQGFAPGQEVARLLLPRSCMNELLEPFAYVASLWREPGEIDVEVRHRLSPSTASIFYHLNPDFTLRAMTVGASFERAHAELVATHVVHHALSPTEIAGLRNIRYLSTTATK